MRSRHDNKSRAYDISLPRPDFKDNSKPVKPRGLGAYGDTSKEYNRLKGR